MAVLYSSLIDPMDVTLHGHAPCPWTLKQELNVDKVNENEPRLAKRVDSHVGGRIRKRRTLLGLTQEQLAAALDISYQQVQKYETGANRVSAGRLYQISQELSVEVGYFFEGLDQMETETMPHGGRNRPTIELAKNFSEIDNPSVRAAVSNLVRTLTSGEHDDHEDSAADLS